MFDIITNADGSKFYYCQSEGGEVWGQLVEADGTKHDSGWWRTEDVAEANKRAQALVVEG